MKILFLTNVLPYPPYSGGVIKSYNLIDFLSKCSDLSLISLLKNDDAEHEAKFREKFRFNKYYSKAVNIERTSINFFKSIVCNKTLNLYRNFDKEVKEKIDEFIPKHDIIFVDHYEMFQYIPANCEKKVVFHEHNAEFIMWKRFSEVSSNFVKKKILHFESKRIVRAELKYCQRADIIFAAPNDQLELINMGANKEKFKTTYHLGNDENLKLPKLNYSDTDESLLYVGTLTWEANIDGLIWFIDNIWGNLTEQFPNLKFNIIGKNPDIRLIKIKAKYKNIILHGFVEDLNEFYRMSRVFVVPQRFGSGIKVKILDAMYRGIPCVTTSIGVEGLQIKNGKELMIADDEQNFAKYVAELLTDKILWENLNTNSRKLAADKYTWQKMLEEHFKDMEKVIN
jgi:glycosyltransferase involved in cell wall biosynthesis